MTARAGRLSRSVWTDHGGRSAEVPDPPAEGSCYRAIGDFQGAGYARNAFAQGTQQEAGFLHAVLGLAPGARVVDVGCGTGRHVRALAGHDLTVVGIDVSAGLLSSGAAAGSGHFAQADARALPLPDEQFDAVLCLCQGGFGLTPEGDRRVLGELARVLRPGGRLALTAFSLAFAARWLAPTDHFDVARGMVHTAAEVRGPDDERRTYDLWTTCYSAGHLVDLLGAAGLRVDMLSGVQPGAYGSGPPTLRDPELLVVATRGLAGRRTAP